MKDKNFQQYPILPADAWYRSRLVMPSDPLKYKTLVAADMTWDARSYTTLNPVQSGTDIDITFAGNLASTNPRQFAYALYDTLIPSAPTDDVYAGWMLSVYLAFDTSGFTGSEGQNLGIWFFTDTPEALSGVTATGTGYFGGGTISDAAEANRSLKTYQTGNKNQSGLIYAPTVITPNADGMTATFLINRYGSSGLGAQANTIDCRFGAVAFRNDGVPSWDATPQTTVSSLPRTNGSNLQFGIWFSRNSAGAFSHTFKITEFSYALLEIVP